MEDQLTTCDIDAATETVPDKKSGNSIPTNASTKITELQSVVLENDDKDPTPKQPPVAQINHVHTDPEKSHQVAPSPIYCEIRDCFQPFTSTKEFTKHIDEVHRAESTEPSTEDTWSWKCLIGDCKYRPLAFETCALWMQHRVFLHGEVYDEYGLDLEDAEVRKSKAALDGLGCYRY